MNAVFTYDIPDIKTYGTVEWSSVNHREMSPQELRADIAQTLSFSPIFRIFEIELFIGGSSVMKAIRNDAHSNDWSVYMTADDLFCESSVATLHSNLYPFAIGIALNMIAISDLLSYVFEETAENSYVENPFVDGIPTR